MKILIVKPSSLGDVVQALPVLRLLKLHFPQSRLFWWLADDLMPLLQNDRDLEAVFPFFRRRWASPGHWLEWLKQIQTLRAHRFDWVIDLQALARSGFFAWLCAGGLTIGLDDPREGARGFYDIVVSRPHFYTHAVDWYLAVLKTLGVPTHRDFVWIPQHPELAREIRQRWLDPRHRWLILQPGARWPNKRWPVEHFAQLARRLTANFPGLRIALLGSSHDHELGRAIAQLSPERCLNLTGQTSLLEMIECIRQCELMVTNDTGPMHVAAALAKPVVAIFGPTEPRRTGPYGQVDQVLQHNLACVPCLRSSCRYIKPLECLRAISPDAVYEQIQKRLPR